MTGRGLAEQDGIASEAKDKIGPAVGGDHVDDLRGGKMTVAADQDVGVGPVVTQIGQQPDQDHGIFGPGGAGARAQVGRDQRMGGPFENEERQRAMVLIVMIIEGKLLLAMGGIIGVIQIEHDSGGRLRVTGDEVVHEGPREPIEVFAVYLCSRRENVGRTGQACSGLQGGRSTPSLNMGSRRRLLASLPSAHRETPARMASATASATSAGWAKKAVHPPRPRMARPRYAVVPPSTSVTLTIGLTRGKLLDWGRGRPSGVIRSPSPADMAP